MLPLESASLLSLYLFQGRSPFLRRLGRILFQLALPFLLVLLLPGYFFLPLLKIEVRFGPWHAPSEMIVFERAVTDDTGS